MVVKRDPLPALYEADETAWLEEMVRRLKAKAFDSIDFKHLAEYLGDNASWDRSQVEIMVMSLVAARLKWDYRSRSRGKSWRVAIVRRANDLGRWLDAPTLYLHAQLALRDTYREAVDLARLGTDLDRTAFPAECPYTVETLLDTESVMANATSRRKARATKGKP